MPTPAMKSRRWAWITTWVRTPPRHGHTLATIIKEMFPDGANLVGIEGTAGHMQTIQINDALATDLGEEYVWLIARTATSRPNWR